MYIALNIKEYTRKYVIFKRINSKMHLLAPMEINRERIAMKLGEKNILVFVEFFCPSEE
jgi:hypothetical protein